VNREPRGVPRARRREQHDDGGEALRPLERARRGADGGEHGGDDEDRRDREEAICHRHGGRRQLRGGQRHGAAREDGGRNGGLINRHTFFADRPQFCHQDPVSSDVWYLGSSSAARAVSSALDALTDSFRSAFTRTGMNFAQSIVVVAIDLARRAWRGGGN